MKMLEIGYVATGTELIFNDLSQLERRQQLSKEALELLTEVQNLHNQIIPINTPDLIDRPFPSGIERWLKAFDHSKKKGELKIKLMKWKEFVEYITKENPIDDFEKSLIKNDSFLDGES